MSLETKHLGRVNDFIIWYAKDKSKVKYHQLYYDSSVEGDTHWNLYELNGKIFEMTKEQIFNHKLLPKGAIPVRLTSLYPIGYNPKRDFEVEFEGKKYRPIKGRSWKFSEDGFKKLVKAKRIMPYKGGKLNYILKLSDYPVSPMHSLWHETAPTSSKLYVVQTSPTPIQRCMLMTTDPGDLVLDPTCGSGTTAYVAEQWGRRWITCDTSRVAITLAKQRLMTAVFDYYELAYPNEGISGGFKYRTAPHITLGSITGEEQRQDVILFDRPYIDRSKKRVTGPFTVEAVPSQRVMSFDEVEKKSKQEADITIAREGETLKQNEWIDKMLLSGIRGKSGQILKFVRIETLKGTRWIHAEAETEDGKRAVISFGPEYSPLEQRQVELAIEEAQTLVPKPKIVIFASFQFDPEASKDIDELNWPGVTVLKVQMDTDLLTEDLKKKTRDTPSFWLIGQPDVELKKKGDKYIVVVNGFDYYNTKTGEIESGDVSKIAMWELDTDYDGRSLYPRQVFFPMAGSKEGWSKLARTLKAQIDEELIEKYRGHVSLPFKLGKNKQIAVKIIDDRGIESLKIIRVRE